MTSSSKFPIVRNAGQQFSHLMPDLLVKHEPLSTTERCQCVLRLQLFPWTFLLVTPYSSLRFPFKYFFVRETLHDLPPQRDSNQRTIFALSHSNLFFYNSIFIWGFKSLMPFFSTRLDKESLWGQRLFLLSFLFFIFFQPQYKQRREEFWHIIVNSINICRLKG